MKRYFLLFLVSVFLAVIPATSHAFTLFWKDGHTQELKNIKIQGDIAECQVPIGGLWFETSTDKLDIGKTLSSKKKEDDEIKAELEAENAKMAEEEKKRLEEEKITEQKRQEEEEREKQEEKKRIEAEKKYYRKKVGEKIWNANNDNYDLIKKWADCEELRRLKFSDDKLKLSEGTKIKVLNYDPDEVTHSIVYINSKNKIKIDSIDFYSLETEDEYQAELKEQAKEKHEEAEMIRNIKHEEAEKIRAREKAIQTFPFEVQQKIRDGKIWIGMTKEMARVSWGEPKSNNRDVGPWGVHEQWVYGDGTYVYFENGIFTSWQD